MIGENLADECDACDGTVYPESSHVVLCRRHYDALAGRQPANLERWSAGMAVLTEGPKSIVGVEPRPNEAPCRADRNSAETPQRTPEALPCPSCGAKR